MEHLVNCSNIGQCVYAVGAPRLEFDIVACPYCGKIVGSPHRLRLEATGPFHKIGEEFLVAVTLEKIGDCGQTVSLALELEGSAPQLRPLKNAVSGHTENFNLGPLRGGLHQLCAVLTTSDGRKTASNTQVLLVGQPPDRFRLWAWALILLLILSLGVSLSWTDEPLFGQPSPSWISVVKAIWSIFVPVAVGLLLMDLGRRERARASGGGIKNGRLRSLIVPFGESSRVGDFVARKVSRVASLGTVLIVLGALPICFVLARLAGTATSWLGGSNAGTGALVASLVAPLLGAVVVVLVFWPDSVPRLLRRVRDRARKLPSGATDSGPDTGRAGQ